MSKKDKEEKKAEGAKPASAGETKPFATIAYQFMSGDEDAADENGGDKAWDPMWGRGIKESIIFAYGTLYGAGYWSNMHYPKVEFGGRLGKYKYYDMDDTIAACMQDYKRIMEK